MADWQTIAQVSVTPDVPEQDIGSFSLGENDDTIWVRVTQQGDDSPNPWSYGILSWLTTEGYELGSTKVFGNTNGTVVRLGVGRPPSVRDGRFIFQPRGFNLRWAKEGFTWTLSFEAISGSSGDGTGVASGAAVVNSFVDTANNGLSLVRVNFP